MRLDHEAAQTVDQIAHQLMDQGFSPRDVRLHFQKSGIRWSYVFKPGFQNSREKARRMRQFKLCVSGCGNKAAGGASGLCEPCLIDKWQARP
jgi:hypothetical protein